MKLDPPRLDPTWPPLRTYESVRERIDAKLGDGIGLGAGEAASRLAPDEHAVWVLDNLLGCLWDHRFHIWDQGFAGRDYDGPAALAALAEAARDLDPVVADLLRWTARWNRTRGIPLVSVVPYVWEPAFPRAKRFLFALAERWPAEGPSPRELPAPAPWARPELAPAATGVRFPTVRIGFTAKGAACPVRLADDERGPEAALRRVLFELWTAGAPDASLDDLFHESGELARSKKEPELYARWVSLDGDGGDPARLEELRERFYPQHPIARFAGVPELPSGPVLLVESADLDTLEPHLTRPYERVRATAERPATLVVRSLLRMDPDWLMVEAADLAPDDWDMLLQAHWTGHGIIVGGRGPAVDAFAAKLREHGEAASLLDRRRAP